MKRLTRHFFVAALFVMLFSPVSRSEDLTEAYAKAVAKKDFEAAFNIMVVLTAKRPDHAPYHQALAIIAGTLGRENVFFEEMIILRGFNLDYFFSVINNKTVSPDLVKKIYDHFKDQKDSFLLKAWEGYAKFPPGQNENSPGKILAENPDSTRNAPVGNEPGYPPAEQTQQELTTASVTDDYPKTPGFASVPMAQKLVDSNVQPDGKTVPARVSVERKNTASPSAELRENKNTYFNYFIGFGIFVLGVSLWLIRTLDDIAFRKFEKFAIIIGFLTSILAVILTFLEKFR